MSHPLSEIIAVSDGPSDWKAIREYLSLKDGNKIATLAALMAPPSKKFDAPELVNAALELQGEADSRVTRLRQAHAVSMNAATLSALAEKLNIWGGGPPTKIEDEDERLTDPIAGPVLRQLRRLESWRSEESIKRRKTSIADALTLADSRTTIPRPSLPCNLEEALRYATDEPDVAWIVLEKALIGMLSTFNDWESRDADEEKQFQRGVDLHTAVLNGSRGTDPNDPCRLPSMREHEEELGKCQSRLSDLQAERFYRENFRPGIPDPGSLAEGGIARYAAHWKNPGCVTDETTLGFLTTAYYGFWARHGPEYVQIHTADEKQAKAVSKQTSEAGKKGATTRVHRNWIKRTNDFIHYLSDDAKEGNLGDLQARVTDFTIHHSGFKSVETQTDIRDFLGALCASANQATPDGIYELLKNLGLHTFKELPFEKQNARIAKMNKSDAAAFQNGKIPKCLVRFQSLTPETVKKSFEMLKAALPKWQKKN
jgi:hypothetical protein